MARLDSFLRLVVEQKASDLHFHAGNVPLIRHDGDILPLPFRVLSEVEAQRFLFEIMTPEQREIFERDCEVDFAYEILGLARFRANVFTQRLGLGSVFRVIPSAPPTLDDLGFPPVTKTLSQLPNGLVLLTGPTGSGKSTTLAAIVHEINRASRRHVVTIEDPVEFVHEPIQSVISQRQVGIHIDSFASALRSALREAPDVVVVGEMRDAETIGLALSAAETSMLVIGTLHTTSAGKAVSRILDVFPEESREQVRSVLAMLLRGIIAQNLCKRADGEGRIAIIEVLLSNYAIANLIRENKVFQIDTYLQSAEQSGSGMQSGDSCLLKFLRAGLVTIDEAVKYANTPDQLRAQAAVILEEE